MVKHKANDSGVETVFRITDSAGGRDIGAIVLTALVADRDVDITYNPGQTTGCGPEPAITYIRIY